MDGIALSRVWSFFTSWSVLGPPDGRRFSLGKVTAHIIDVKEGAPLKIQDAQQGTKALTTTVIKPGHATLTVSGTNK